MDNNSSGIENIAEVVLNQTGWSKFWAFLSRHPVFKKVFVIVSIITIIFWILFALYWTLEKLRAFINWLTQKNIFWTAILACVCGGVGYILVAQFVGGQDIFGAIGEFFTDLWNTTWDSVGEFFTSL